MISNSTNSGLGVLQQTSIGLLQGRSSPYAIQALTALSSPLSSRSQVNSQSGNSEMIQQLASEKQSADSAENLLKEVYQRLHSASEASTNGASGTVPTNWQELKNDLKITKDNLLELESQSKSSPSSKKIYSVVRQGLDDALNAANQANSLGPTRGLPALQNGERKILAAITRVDNISKNLEKASLNIFKIQKAYSGFSAPKFSSNNFSSFSLDTAQAQQFSGLVLDIVR
jgi:hypothetical protein